MLTIPDPLFSRREWLRVGGLGLGGLTLAAHSKLAASPAKLSSAFGKAKSVIIFGLMGGPSQYETFDPKPDAPAEIRGIFGTIPSRTPGMRVCELMPRTANLSDKLAVLRAVTTGDNAHSSSGYQMLTGIPHQPMNMENATPKAPNNWPSIGAIVRTLRPAPGELPSAITIPEHIWNDGNIPWPGQDGGFLGQKSHPWVVACDPSSPQYRIPAMSLPEDISTLRFDERRGLLEQVNSHFDRLYRSGALESHDIHTRKAIDLLGSVKARRAFAIDQESQALRDRYGRSRFAQSCLMARRLVESGVSLVQVNWTRIANQPNQGGWDTHEKHNEAVKNVLMPIADQAFSALIEDLEIRGLLDSTLVVWWGEFGRTPKFNGRGGRDHWGNVFSLALAGGGIRGGVVHGASDKQGAFPADGRVEPRDLMATIFHCMGYAPDTEMIDNLGRPLPISRGEVIRAIV